RLAPQPEPAAPQGAAPGEEEVRRVYLICEPRDLPATGEIESYLFEQGLEVILPLFEGDEAQVRRDHEESLVLCDAALLYYGNGNELWLRKKLRELQKSAGYGRPRPMLAKGIYLAPPGSEAKRRLRTHEAMVLGTAGELVPAELDPFVRQVRG